MELSAIVRGDVTLQTEERTRLSVRGNGLQLHGNVLYGIAVLIHHTAGHDGARRHFDFVIGKLLAGLERNQADRHVRVGEKWTNPVRSGNTQMDSRFRLVIEALAREVGLRWRRRPLRAAAAEVAGD